MKIFLPNKKRIAIETQSFDKGGLEKVVLDIAIEFKKNGWSPYIISNGPIGKLGMEANKYDIPVFRSKNHLILLAILIRYRPVVSMSHFTYKGYPIYKILKIKNLTFIHNVYAFFSDSQKKQFLKSDKFVNKYISVSKCATNYAVNNLAIPSEKIVTIPNGLNIEEHLEKEKLDLDWKNFGVEENDFVFLNVAAYNLHKNHYLMANALSKLLPEFPNIKIICCGSPVYEPHYYDLLKYLENLNIENSMILIGHQSNLSWFYRNAHVFLLPSLIEGWSIAMNEAMFHELPLILSNVGGAPEVISNSDIGIIISNEYGKVESLNSQILDEIAYSPRQYDTEQELMEAMRNMILNYSNWKQQGKLGRQKIVKLYNLETTVEKYLHVIEEVLEK